MGFGLPGGPRVPRSARSAAPALLALLDPHASQGSVLVHVYVGSVASWPWDALAHTGPAMLESLALAQLFQPTTKAYAQGHTQPLSDTKKALIVTLRGYRTAGGVSGICATATEQNPLCLLHSCLTPTRP